MRILLVQGNDASTKEVAEHSAALGLALAKGGYPISIVTTEDGLNDAQRTKVENRGVELSGSLPKFEMLDERLYAQSHEVREVLSAHIDAFEPELIVSQGFLLGSYAATREAKRRHLPISCISHGREAQLINGSPAMRDVARSTFELSTARLATSTEAKAALARLLGVEGDRIEVVPPGTSVNGGVLTDMRARPLKITVVGPLDIERGVPHLILAALPKILGSHREAKLTFVGGGPDEAELRSLLEHLKSGDKQGVKDSIAALGTTEARRKLVHPLERKFAGKKEAPFAHELSSRVRFEGDRDDAFLREAFEDTRVAVFPAGQAGPPATRLIDALASGCFVVLGQLGGPSADLVEWLRDSSPHALWEVRQGVADEASILARSLRGALSEWTPALARQTRDLVQMRHGWRGLAMRLLPHAPPGTRERWESEPPIDPAATQDLVKALKR